MVQHRPETRCHPATVRDVTADGPESPEAGRSHAPAARAPLVLFDLRPWEWIVVGVVAATIVIVNRAVIHDRGNSWASLLVLSFFAAVVVGHAIRWVRRHS